jgi:hypothetical protein
MVPSRFQLTLATAYGMFRAENKERLEAKAQDNKNLFEIDVGSTCANLPLRKENNP